MYIENAVTACLTALIWYSARANSLIILIVHFLNKIHKMYSSYSVSSILPLILLLQIPDEPLRFFFFVTVRDLLSSITIDMGRYNIVSLQQLQKTKMKGKT